MKFLIFSRFSSSPKTNKKKLETTTLTSCKDLQMKEIWIHIQTRQLQHIFSTLFFPKDFQSSTLAKSTVRSSAISCREEFQILIKLMNLSLSLFVTTLPVYLNYLNSKHDSLGFWFDFLQQAQKKSFSLLLFASRKIVNKRVKVKKICCSRWMNRH